MFIEPMLASSASEKKRATLSPETGYILEPKHDGMRAVIVKRDGKVKIFSRVGLEYQDHLPALVKGLEALPDNTVLDGELMVIKTWWGIEGDYIPVADFNQTMRIMGANPDKAVARQGEHTVQFCAFDILELNGETWVNDTFSDRRDTLAVLMEIHDLPDVFLNPMFFSWDDETINNLWKAGIEGAILKNNDSKYIPGKRRANTWYKVKAELTADVVVMGFTDAKEGKTGKFLGKVGAIRFGAFNAEGLLHEVGQCSGMNDAERDRWTTIRDSGENFTNRVIEVKYNDLVGISEYGTPRHPQFKTERIDKRPEDCLMEQFRLAG